MIFAVHIGKHTSKLTRCIRHRIKLQKKEKQVHNSYINYLLNTIFFQISYIKWTYSQLWKLKNLFAMPFNKTSKRMYMYVYIVYHNRLQSTLNESYVRLFWTLIFKSTMFTNSNACMQKNWNYVFRKSYAAGQVQIFMECVKGASLVGLGFVNNNELHWTVDVHIINWSDLQLAFQGCLPRLVRLRNLYIRKLSRFALS